MSRNNDPAPHVTDAKLPHRKLPSRTWGNGPPDGTEGGFIIDSDFLRDGGVITAITTGWYELQPGDRP